MLEGIKSWQVKGKDHETKNVIIIRIFIMIVNINIIITVIPSLIGKMSLPAFSTASTATRTTTRLCPSSKNDLTDSCAEIMSFLWDSSLVLSCEKVLSIESWDWDSKEQMKFFLPSSTFKNIKTRNYLPQFLIKWEIHIFPDMDKSQQFSRVFSLVLSINNTFHDIVKDWSGQTNIEMRAWRPPYWSINQIDQTVAFKMLPHFCTMIWNIRYTKSSLILYVYKVVRSTSVGWFVGKIYEFDDNLYDMWVMMKWGWIELVVWRQCREEKALPNTPVHNNSICHKLAHLQHQDIYDRKWRRGK